MREFQYIMIYFLIFILSDIMSTYSLNTSILTFYWRFEKEGDDTITLYGGDDLLKLYEWENIGFKYANNLLSLLRDGKVNVTLKLYAQIYCDIKFFISAMVDKCSFHIFITIQ